MKEEMTCGKGIAENSAFTAAFAAFLSAVVKNLETHLKALDRSDENSRPEYETYQDLVKRHRELVSQLQATSERMAQSRDIPMASHDPVVMGSPEVLKAFEEFVAREKDLLALLEMRLKQDAAMLANFKSAAKQGKR